MLFFIFVTLISAPFECLVLEDLILFGSKTAHNGKLNDLIPTEIIIMTKNNQIVAF